VPVNQGDPEGAVPVIPLPTEGESSSSSEMEDFLALFPEDILQSDSQFRPVNLRVVEHEDYIDYEFDFVEAGENQRQPEGVAGPIGLEGFNDLFATTPR